MTDPAVNQQPVMGNEQVTATVAPTSTEAASQVETLSPEEIKKIQKALHDANKEAEKTRLELKKYQDKEAEAETAKLSEIDKAKKERDDAKAAAERALKTANDRLIKSEILSKADKFIDTDAAYALVDKSKITVKDDGTIEGVSEAIAELEKAKPHLLKTNPPARPGPTNPGAGGAINETYAQKVERLTGGNTSGIWEAHKG